jgi:hypothetical protein
LLVHNCASGRVVEIVPGLLAALHACAEWRSIKDLTETSSPSITHAEEERLAAALLSVVRRTDFDAAHVEPWLARFVALEQQVWTQAPPDAARLDASQNARSLLQSLFVPLSMPKPDSTAGQVATQHKVRLTLPEIRR